MAAGQGPLASQNQVFSVTYADYFSGSTPSGYIAPEGGAPYNHRTLSDFGVGGLLPKRCRANDWYGTRYAGFHKRQKCGK